MSSWKDSSDFASLAAALSQAKALKNQPKSSEDDKKMSFTEKNEEDKEKKEEEEAKTDHLVSGSSYKELPEDFQLPSMKDSFILKQHKSTVSALEFESSGSRFLSGSHDTTVAYWDFNGMVKDDPVPFRFIEPMGSYTVIFKNFGYINPFFSILFFVDSFA